MWLAYPLWELEGGMIGTDTTLSSSANYKLYLTDFAFETRGELVNKKAKSKKGFREQPVWTAAESHAGSAGSERTNDKPTTAYNII